MKQVDHTPALGARHTEDRQFVQSFEVAQGGSIGDLLTKKVIMGKLRVGLLATSYFEYYRMYQGIEKSVQDSMQRVADKISPLCDLYFPGIVDTLEKSNTAGEYFSKNMVDVVIATEGTYSPDYLLHQALLHLPSDTPLLLFASQRRDRIDFTSGYDVSLLNSGPMGILQFACSLKKMQKHLPYEVTVGSIDDPQAYEDIYHFIQVNRIIRDLRFMNIGLVGHIFRGMYDFQYDKTALAGKLGPHIMDIDLEHLRMEYHSIQDDCSDVQQWLQKARIKYHIDKSIMELDLIRAAKLGVALQRLIKRFSIDGLALLGQHFIEKEFRTTSYLGIAEILAADQAIVVTEGDVLGLILGIVMKSFCGNTPFFGEWEEMDISLNAAFILGHGFIDPRLMRGDRTIRLVPSSEEWGWEGQAPGLDGTFTPGPCTLSAIVSHGEQWKILVSEGTIMDIPPLAINESSLVVRMEKPIKEYFENLIQMGFGHHVMVVPDSIAKQLQMFARRLSMEVCTP